MPTAVITGASSGLGKAIAEAMAGHYEIVDWSLPAVDLRKPENVRDAAARLEKVDALVNCAGVNMPIDHLTEIHNHEWDMVFEINTRAIFFTAKYLIPVMTGGTICNIISSAATQPMTYSLPYNASKAAAAMMTRQMAKELTPGHGITVFGISPGWMEGTAMTEATDKRLMELRGLVPPIDRIRPYLVAEFVAWLLARRERNLYLNGSILEYGT